MLLDEFCGQTFWDTDLAWNTTNPDLTPCFQKTLLTWIPYGLLWFLTPLELHFLKASKGKILPWTGTNISRVIVAMALAVLCLADTMDISFNRRSDIMFTATVIADVLKLCTFILSVILMLCNRRRGRHTSGVLFLFWFTLTICEIFSYRSAFLQLKQQDEPIDESAFIFQMLFFPLLVAELVLNCFADLRKPSSFGYTSTSDGKQCPEQSASFLSKLFFWWFNNMAVLGWRKPLTIADLWELNPDDRSEHVAAKFQKNWKTQKSFGKPDVNIQNMTNGECKEINKSSSFKKKELHIAYCLCKTFWIYFSLGSLCKLVYDTLQFMNPLILKFLIDHVQSPEAPLWKGLLFAFMLFGNGTLQSLLLGNYFHRMFVLGMRVRTALVAAIYEKSLVLSSSSRRETTVGEIVNLMSVDSQRFMDLMTYLNLLWSAPFQIAISLIMLWQLLGPSVLAGLLLMLILIPANGFIASKARKLQVKQMKCKDERVKLLNEVLTGIKVLKLYAWEEAFKEKILGIRKTELHHLKQIAYLNSVSILIWNCSPFLVSLVSFASYVLSDEKHVLDATTAFVSLSLFNILRFPLTMLPHLITTLVMVNVSVKRINKFLNSDELEDYVIRDSFQEHPIIIRSGDFAWQSDDTESDKLILHNINLTIKKGSLVAIVGQVGSGKSSLLSAILGDMEKIHGSVFLNGTTSYVSQQPWIQNETMMNNILFAQPYQKDLYNDVLDACGLVPDLAILPGGDQTEIGEKGINLSGGQKQRVSLARAVYSSSDIYIMDDPLSAVDSHVGRHIFDKVIGPKGLLQGKTRILVTHGLTYLSQTDVVIVMKDGAIAEMGSFQQLIDNKGSFAEFLSQYLQEVTEDESDLEILEDIGQKNPEFLRSISEMSSEIEYPLEKENRRLSSHSVNRSLKQEAQAAKLPENNTKLINTEAAETGEVNRAVYMKYLRSVGYIWVLSILLFYVAWQVVSVESNVWLSEWGTDPLGPNGTQDIQQRDLRLGVYGGLGLLQALMVFAASFTIAFGTLAASKILHNEMLYNVLRSPMSFFDTTPLGRVVNRFAKDVDTVDVTIPMTIRSWLSCFLQAFATIIVISIQTPIFMTIIIPLGVLYYIIQRFYVSTSRQLKRLESITRSPIYSHFSETLAGCSTIRAYAVQERFCKHSRSLVDNNQICYYPSIVSNRWLAIRLDFCGNSIIFFSALFAVLNKNDLDPGKVGLSVSYALLVTATLNWLVRMNSELETNIVAVERILEYTVTPTEARWVNDDVKVSPKWPDEGHIQLSNYSCRYREGLDPVLKDVSCIFLPTEKVGIVGRTGAGKSSLTLSLFRIIEASEGSITIDGMKIADLGLHQLRSKITIIPQDPVLFSGSLRLNLDPFSSYTDEKLWEALEHAHLKNFVATLEKGLSHEIVEGGENLSVGQRQLVCLARALLRKTKVLVLDEATAAVDLETDNLIQTTIRDEFADCTILTIAHRLNTVMDYDRIMVMDNGRIAEFDTPGALLENRKSVFYGMAKDAGLV